jgi:hypothetical protein
MVEGDPAAAEEAIEPRDGVEAAVDVRGVGGAIDQLDRVVVALEGDQERRLTI